MILQDDSTTGGVARTTLEDCLVIWIYYMCRLEESHRYLRFLYQLTYYSILSPFLTGCQRRSVNPFLRTLLLQHHLGCKARTKWRPDVTYSGCLSDKEVW